MKTDGTVAVVPYHEIKTVCFVRDFEPTEAPPDRLVFHTRPKMDGLWVRMRFRDGEVMDGILSNNQKIFSPRQALSEFHVLGVVGSPLTRRRRKEVPKEQIGLFEPQE